MADYRYLTTWVLDAPLEPVWETIHDVARWPEWWRGVESVEELGQDTYRHVWRSVVPYPVRFDVHVTRVEDPGRQEAVVGHSILARHSRKPARQFGNRGVSGRSLRRTEYAGLVAGRGNSAVVIRRTRQSSPASSKIASAKSAHVHSPSAATW